MKTVFCLDGKPQYTLLCKTAVRSLRRTSGPDAPVLCVLGAGPECDEAAEAMAREGVPVARHAPVLARETLAPRCHATLGMFLKLELALVPELAGEEHCLYCDADVLVLRPFPTLAALRPRIMAMAEELRSPLAHGEEYRRFAATGQRAAVLVPFHHPRQTLTYRHKDNEITVRMPFPHWERNSGVALFNLAHMRRRDAAWHFLDFCAANSAEFDNFDQAMLNYYFGRRIELLDQDCNCPPWMPQALTSASIVHFYGLKPWRVPALADTLTTAHKTLAALWFETLTGEEREQALAWAAQEDAHPQARPGGEPAQEAEGI